MKEHVKVQEIGGYFELEELKGTETFHTDCLALNSGRSCLLYLLQNRKIEQIYLPYYICDSVIKLCEKSGCNIKYYHIDKDFLPVVDKIEENSYYYIINYFGTLDCKWVENFHQQHKKIILDYAQAFFRKPVVNVDTIYTCRKFLGVPDGAYLYTDLFFNNDCVAPFYTSNVEYLIGRYEESAKVYFQNYQQHEEKFDSVQVFGMSKFASSILRNIDYEEIKKKRTDNYAQLHNALKDNNPLNVPMAEGNFAYPFYSENGVSLRKYLIEHNIFIPLLWRNVIESMPENSIESLFARNIVFLPCDQRYNKDEMNIIIQLVTEYNRKGRGA